MDIVTEGKLEALPGTDASHVFMFGQWPSAQKNVKAICGVDRKYAGQT